MKIKAQVLVTIAFMAVLSCTYAERHDTPGSGNEIIVKFAADQAVNETIMRAFNDANAEASLEQSVLGLSEELGVPFVYSRLTSGREIVVEIPTRQVFEVIAERLRESDAVENTAVEIRTAGDVLNGPSEILVTIDRSKIELGPDVDADALAARLVGDERFPVTCDIRTDGRLAITPDFEDLVGTLVNELASRHDIDYAQPNYRVRHYDVNQ